MREIARLVAGVAVWAFCAGAHAHLNHVQFATVEEVGGKLVVRYRMSADMFQSNLDVLIKSGAIGQDVLRLPIERMIQKYFEKHLMVDKRAAENVKYTLDQKNGDWVAEFEFKASGKPIMFCDAFLENNPNTQTLARISWRGEQTVFHFRKGNVEHVLGRHENDTSLSRVPERQYRIEKDTANSLRAHWAQGGLLALVLLLRYLQISKRAWMWIGIAVFINLIMLGGRVFGMAAIVIAVVATVNSLIKIPRRNAL